VCGPVTDGCMPDVTTPTESLSRFRSKISVALSKWFINGLPPGVGPEG
jgi:hypothetical protein